MAGETSGSWWSDFFLSPQILGAAAAMSALAAATLWYLSARPEPAPAFVVPPGWILLSADTPKEDLVHFPPDLLAKFRSGELAAVGVERPDGRFGTVDQGFGATVLDGPLDTRTAVDKLPGVARETAVLAGVPDELIRKTEVGVLDAGGSSVVQARVVTDRGDVFTYAAPFGQRTAVYFYSCAPSQCARVKRLSEAAVLRTGGITPPSFLHTGPGKRRCRALSVLAMVATLSFAARALRAGGVFRRLNVRSP